MKMEIIERKKKGEGNSAIGRAMGGLAESTVRTVWSNRAKIEKILKCYGASAVDNRSRAHDPAMVVMERYLLEFVRRKMEEGISIDSRFIREKAMTFYATACSRTHTTQNNRFRASAGWLQKFLQRKDLKNVKLTGERASGDEVAAKEFPAILKSIIKEGGYTPDQIYNCDESGIQYKTMPKSTYISKSVKQARGRKIDKSRITLLLTVNVTGSHKMRPVVVHTAAKPHCYRHLRNMTDSGVYWYKSSNGWMTSKIMADWLIDHAVPDARLHCELLGIPFKMLLLMDNAPCHPSYLQDLDPDCQVVFLPPKTTSLVQPLDQEVIATLKLFYQKHLYNYLRTKTDSNDEIIAMENDPDLDSEAETDTEPQQPPTQPQQAEMTVTAFWRAFTVKNAVNFLLQAWGEVNDATINHAWKELVPHLCKKSENYARVQRADEVARVATAAAQAVAGCGDVTVEEVREVVAAGSQPTVDPVEEIDREDMVHEERGMVEHPTQAPQLTPNAVSTLLAQLDAFKEFLKETEPCPMRRKEVCYNLDNAMRYYYEQHQTNVKNRKQALITRFLARQETAPGNSTPTDNPQPGPSNAPQPGHSNDEDVDDYDGFVREALVEEKRAKLHRIIAQIDDSNSSSDDDDMIGDGDGAGARVL